MPIFSIYYRGAIDMTLPNSMLSLYTCVEFSTLAVVKFRQL